MVSAAPVGVIRLVQVVVNVGKHEGGSDKSLAYTRQFQQVLHFPDAVQAERFVEALIKTCSDYKEIGTGVLGHYRGRD